LLSRSHTKVKDTRSSFWYPREVLVTKNTYVKYQSSCTCHSIVKVLLDNRKTEWQTGHKQHMFFMAMIFTNFLFTIIIKLLLKFQLFWTNGSWEEILEIFSYIYAVKNSFPCCGPHDPPAAINLTNLHCTMSESCHVNFSHSGPVFLEKKIRKTFFLYMHL
jgi:hypothetical protein